MAVVAVFATLGGFAEAALLVTIARLAFALASDNGDVSLQMGPFGRLTLSVGALLGVAAALAVIRVSLQFVQAHLVARTHAGVLEDMRRRVIVGYFGATWALQAQERDGRIQELTSSFVANAANAVMALSLGTVALLSLVAFLATAFFVNIIAALVLVAAGCCVAFVLRPLRNAIRRRSERSARANLELATDVTEYASHLQEVRVFNVEKEVSDRVETSVADAARLEGRFRHLMLLAPAVYQGMGFLLVIGAIGLVYASGVSRLASLGGVVLIMVRSLNYGQQLQSSFQTIHNSAPYFEALRDEQLKHAHARVHRGGATLDTIGTLECREVSFEYEPARPVLRDLNFAYRSGEVVGVVGPSGSGKSTLVQLLLRLREPTSGSILADGRDVRLFSLDSWYRRVSFVPQDPKLFAGTIADNIRFYRNDVDDAAIEMAAKLAGLHEEIMSRPLGYDSPVGERGGEISGGQRQRLSIARALAEEPELLILDEPTSSLDVRSESIIRSTLETLRGRATVVVIAHRLSTLDICDRIMVLADGSIQGFDTPGELARTDPFYREALRLSGLR